MDAKIGDWVVTPRIGKPVEINALWYNALAIDGGLCRAPRQRPTPIAAAADACAEALAGSSGRRPVACTTSSTGPTATIRAVRPEPDLRRQPAGIRRSTAGAAGAAWTHCDREAADPLRPALARARRIRPTAAGTAAASRSATALSPGHGVDLAARATPLSPITGAWRLRSGAAPGSSPIATISRDAGLGTSARSSMATRRTPARLPAQAWSVGCSPRSVRRLRKPSAVPAASRHDSIRRRKS